MASIYTIYYICTYPIFMKLIWIKSSSPRIPRISQKQRCLSVYLSPINGMTTPYLRDSAFSHDDSQRIGIVDVLSKATQKLEEHSRWRFTLVVEKNKRRIHRCKMDGKWKVLPQCPNLLHCFASKGLHQRGLAWRKDRRPMKRLDLAVKVNNFCDTNVTLTWWITERETTSTRMT